jgi:hypothetical protein
MVLVMMKRLGAATWQTPERLIRNDPALSRTHAYFQETHCDKWT